MLAFTTSDRRPLLEHAATHGFRNFTVPVLSKLATYLGMKFDKSKPKPTTLEPLLKALIKHVLPSFADVDVCLASRQEPQMVDTVLNSATLDGVTEALDDFDDKKMRSSMWKN